MASGGLKHEDAPQGAQPAHHVDLTSSGSEDSLASPLLDPDDAGAFEAGSIAEATAAAAADLAPNPAPTKALSVQPWFCGKILNKLKTWELRGRNSKCRMRVALAAQGTNQLWGEVNIVSSELVARKDARGIYCPVAGNEAAFPGLGTNYARHAVRHLDSLPYAEIWAWGLDGAEWYDDPKPYRHPKGQQSWINLGVELDAAGPQKKPATRARGRKPKNEPQSEKQASRFQLEAKLQPGGSKRAAVSAADVDKPSPKRPKVVELDAKQTAALPAWEPSLVTLDGSREEPSVETRKKPKPRAAALAAEEAASRRSEKKAKKAPKEKNEQKEAQAPSVPAEGPSQGDDLRRKPLGLTPDEREEEEDFQQENSEDADMVAFKTWAVAEIDTFATEVANVTAQIDSKKDRFSLSALVAALDSVPEAVLSPAGLLDARETLKKMLRLPRRAKLAGILDLMQALASKARSMREELQACQEKLHEQDQTVEDPNASILQAGAPSEKRSVRANSELPWRTCSGSGQSKSRSFCQEKSEVGADGSGEEPSVETWKKPKPRPAAPAAEEAPSRRAEKKAKKASKEKKEQLVTSDGSREEPSVESRKKPKPRAAALAAEEAPSRRLEKKAKKAPKEKNEQKEAQASSLPAEGPSKGDDLRREPVGLTPDDQEEEEKLRQADAEDADIAALRTWAVAEIDTFATEVANMTAQIDSKKDRFSLSALVAALDGVPEVVLRPVGLLDARETLKKMSRLPRRAKLAGILDSMQALAGKAQSLRKELHACQETLREQHHTVDNPNASIFQAGARSQKRSFRASSEPAWRTSGGSGQSKSHSFCQEKSAVGADGSGEEPWVETRKKPKHRPPAPAPEEAPSKRSEKNAKKAPKEKKEQKEARAPSLPAEGPGTDEDLPCEPLGLSLDDQQEHKDLEQADAEDAEIAAFRTWAVAEIDTFATEVANMTTQMDSKTERFSLSALLAVLDGVPDAVLSPAGLLDARETMKKMSRLPKRAKLAGVLELMQVLAGKAQSMREELRAYQEKLAEQDRTIEAPIYDETSDE